MAVDGGHAGTKKGPNWGHVIVVSEKHPSHDVIFSGKNLAKKGPNLITSHDVLEPLKQVLGHQVM